MAIQEVSVISHHDRTISDKHHGIKYDFKPNEKVLIPLAAAAHIFGLGMPDRSAAWKRHGFTQEAAGMKFFSLFDLDVVNLVAESTDVEAMKEKFETREQELAAKLEELEKAIAELTNENRDLKKKLRKLEKEGA